MEPSLADSEWRRALRLPRPVTLTVMTVAAVLVCSAQASVASANTIPASGVAYLCLTLVMFGCALTFWGRARAAAGALRIRWSLVAAGALAASIGYIPSLTEALLNTPPQRLFQTACFNASEASYILAVVLFFSGVARSVVLVDLLQALLYFLLRFNLVYSPISRDHFTMNHLIVGQFMALFLFLSAVVACLGAASMREFKLLRIFSCFFGLRLIGFFLSNQVSYTWLHYNNCSLWDVPGPALLAAFSLYLLYTSSAARVQPADDQPRAASVLVRSLMPSFLALVNLILGLFLLKVSVTLAAIAMSASLICYVVRTALLQAQSVGEKTLLETRNEHLEGLAVRDPLTGIGNRRSLAAAYSQVQAVAGGECLSLLLTDIDRFKQENDSHGHLHGDKVLIALARKLESFAARIDGSHCARMGGDEFALLLPQVSARIALTLGEELRSAFHMHAAETLHSEVTLSIGIAVLDAARDLPLETLVCCADEALYRAKTLGRNRVEAQPAWQPGTASANPASDAVLALGHAGR